MLLIVPLLHLFLSPPPSSASSLVIRSPNDTPPSVISKYLLTPGVFRPANEKKPLHQARLLTSTSALQILNKKEENKRQDAELKEQRRREREREEAKKRREEEQKQKAEERARKAELKEWKKHEEKKRKFVTQKRSC